MAKMTKNLKSYIQILPFIGIVPILAGVLCAVMTLTDSNPLNWQTYNFNFKLLGALVAYVYISRINPGGRVTLNFDKSTYSEDEKALSDLITKYKSNILMLLAFIIYIVSDFIVSQKYKELYVGSLNGNFGSLLIGAFITLTFCFGIKYLSAWWNIKRNWKKEFGE